MIKIINITNPKTLDLIYDVSDTEYLNTSTGNIMTIEIDNSYYALLSGAGSESVRILNITNPILPDLVYLDLTLMLLIIVHNMSYLFQLS